VISDIELRITPGKGEGIFASRTFRTDGIVLIGVLDGKAIENHSHASQLSETEFGFHVGLTSKFNHSCDPNCGIRLNDKGAHDFVAMRPIAQNEEATFDYAMRNFRIEHFPGSCTCGEELCRGSVTGWRDLPHARKQAYQGFVAPHLVAMDHADDRREQIVA